MLDNNLQKIDLTPKTEASPPTSPLSANPLAIKIALGVIVALLGLGSGYFLFVLTTPSKNTANSRTSVSASPGGLKVGDIVGIRDEKGFKDKPAVGVLQEGGLNGEGSHHLARPGGVSQTVYLTSSYVDLDQFIGHRITVWGETFNGQKAGWLMDVGRVKVEELNAPLPDSN